MNQRVIKSILRKKFNDFVASIKDDKVKALVEKNTIITGGAIASMLLKEPVNDFDLYFTNKETVLAVAEYYVGLFNEEHNIDALVLDGNVYNFSDVYNDLLPKRSVMLSNLTPERVMVYISSDGVSGDEPEDKESIDINEILEDADTLPADTLEPEAEKPKYRPVFLSPNAITLSNKIQLIIRFYGDADTIHENYDFAHCTSYWESDGGKLTLRTEALEALLAKELRYVASRYPICSMVRMRKFIKRGFHINAGQIFKIAYAVSQLDLNDIAVLEDQLIGVDTAYFNQLIRKLQKVKEEDSDFELDFGRIAELVDKIFG